MILNIIKAARPLLWTKTFWAMFLGSFIVFNSIPPLKEFIIGFIILGPLMWSGLYILNDLSDIKKDRQSGEKRYRVIASGKLSVKHALITSISLISLSLILAATINLFFFLAILLTLINQAIYTLPPFRFKESANFDFISCGIIGQVLRLFAGWFLFTSSFNIPIIPILLVISVKTGGFLFYRLTFYKTELKLKYKSTIVKYPHNKIKKVAISLLALGFLSFIFLTLNSIYFPTLDFLGILPFKLIYFLSFLFLILPLYLYLLKNPEKIRVNLFRNIGYCYLAIVLIALILFL